MWKELKRMVVEAAAETADDQTVKERVTKLWGTLISHVIGEMKNGFPVAARHQFKQSIESPGGRAKSWNCVCESMELLSARDSASPISEPMSATAPFDPCTVDPR